MAVTLEQAQIVHSRYISRQYDYQHESDPLMVKYMLGDITKEEWQAARQAVKDKNPYPEGVDKEEALQMIRDETGWEF